MAHPAHPVLPVRIAHHVQSGRRVHHVVRVKIPAEYSFVEPLQSNDHAVGRRAVREPVHDSGLEKHVPTAVQILGVGDLANGHEPSLRVPDRGAHEPSLVGRKVGHARRELAFQPLRHEVVASVLDVLADVHDVFLRRRVGLARQDFFE